MRVKWEDSWGRKFEGEVIDKLCNFLYIRLDDGSIKNMWLENITVISE